MDVDPTEPARQTLLPVFASFTPELENLLLTTLGSSIRRESAALRESRNTALLGSIGTCFSGFIPSLILHLVKKTHVPDQSKEALNWSIGRYRLCQCALAFIAIGFTMMVVGPVIWRLCAGRHGGIQWHCSLIQQRASDYR